MTTMAQHREVFEAELARLGPGVPDWPDVLGDPRLSGEARLSGVLLLLEETQQHVPITFNIVDVGLDDDSLDVWGRQRQPWAHLGRLKLPWTAATATLAMTLVQRGFAADERAAAVALRGAKQVCDQGLADVGLLRALERFVHVMGPSEMAEREQRDLHHLARRALAAATPPGLLDLSMISDEDGWGPHARAAATDLPPDDIAPLVRLLGDLGARRPSKRWLDQVGEALHHPAARDLLEVWLTCAARTDVVSLYPDFEASDVGTTAMGTLFRGANGDLVRAAVLATTVLPDAAWPPPLLGELALRGSAHNGLAGFTEALALKVASASVDALIARDGPQDRQVLTTLLEDLQRRDLLRRVGKALGRDDVATARSGALQQAKAKEVRRKASRGTEKARAAMDSHLREHLGATLRSVGLTGGPRTWRRRHPDREDRVVIQVSTGWVAADHGVTNDLRLTLSYGTRFDAAHPTDDPDSRFPGYQHLDIELHHDLPGDISPERLRHLAALVASTAVPFLDSLGQYAAARDVLENDESIPDGAEPFMGPAPNLARSRSLGLLALQAGDRATARHHLRAVQTALTAKAETGDTAFERDFARAEIGFWGERLRRADELP